MKSMLADSHDDEAVSVKRVVTLIAFILCCVAFIADLFTDLSITQAIYDSMVYIVLGGFGFTGLEKFASPNYSKPDRSDGDEDSRYYDPAPDTEPDIRPRKRRGRQVS